MKRLRTLSEFSCVCLCFALASCSTRCAQTPQTEPIDLPVSHGSTPGTQTPEAPWQLGIGTHLFAKPATSLASLAALHRLGARSLREDIPWDYIERTRGTRKVPLKFDELVDSARASGIEPLLILDYGHPAYEDGTKPETLVGAKSFAGYAAFVASHFVDRVRYYEVWNEWDATTGNTPKGNADNYATLARETYQAVKAVAPSAKVLVGAATSDGTDQGFTRRLVELGALEWSDGISLHSYIHCRGDTRPEAWYRWVQKQYEDLSAVARRPFELYVTEMGWPAHEGKCGVNPTTQAKYLARTLVLARTLPYLMGLWWYDLADDGEDAKQAEHNFGILRRDLTPKPAATALANLSAIVSTGTAVKVWKPVGESLWGVLLKRPTENVWALWSTKEDACFSVELSSNGYLSQQRILSAAVPSTVRVDGPSATEDRNERVYVSDEVLLLSSQATVTPRFARPIECSSQ